MFNIKTLFKVTIVLSCIVFCTWENVANAGSKASDEACTLKSAECADGLYCYDRTWPLSDICVPKIADEKTCASGTIITESDLDNCRYGCKSGKYYLAAADMKKGGAGSGYMSYQCQAPGTGSDANAQDISSSGSAQLTDRSIPGTSIDKNSGIVKCGRPGMRMCTLCDLIAGLNEVIQYIMKIAIGVALLAMAIGGVMYVVSAGESAMMEMAKKAITNAAIGFVLVFTAFLIVNTTISYLGTIKDAKTKEPTLGIAVVSWGHFDCTAPVVISGENAVKK